MADTVKKKDLIGKGKLGAVLDEDRIEEIAKKEYSNDEVGPKTIEGKKASLRNLRPRVSKVNVSEIKETINLDALPDDEKLPLFYLNTYAVLSEDEQKFYILKWEEYMSEFKLSSSADQSLLHIVIMEEIIYNRLYKEQLNSPNKDLSRAMSESVKRHTEALKNLGISRTQRLTSKSNQDNNIATLVQQFDKSKILELDKKMEEQEQEEEKLLGKKKKQFKEELKAIKENTNIAPPVEEVVKPSVEPEQIKEEVEDLSKRIKSVFDEAGLK